MGPPWLVRPLILIVLLATPLAGCTSTGTSDAGRCAMIWNEDPPVDLSDRFDEAIAYRWIDEADDDGCGVVFVSGDGRPWTIFGGVVADDRVEHWSRVDGERWGEDSPEGGPTEPNVVVLPGGVLSVPA
jgi:hypothetical protein